MGERVRRQTKENQKIQKKPKNKLSNPSSTSSGQYTQENYTLSEAWSGVNWADLMAAHGTFWTDFYDRPKPRTEYNLK